MSQLCQLVNFFGEIQSCCFCIYILYILRMMSSREKLSTRPISIRLRPEVLAWFKQKSPKGYQTHMHAVLSEYVERQRATTQRNIGRAQEIYRQYYAQCFWHLDPNLEITSENLHIVIDGLRKFGGRRGFLIASELCQ